MTGPPDYGKGRGLSGAAPPCEEGSGRLGLIPASTEKKQKLASRHYYPLLSFTSVYSRLLAKRHAEGLLDQFLCYRCGRPALDPLGFDGPHKPLCRGCAQ
jgi:hypothetical protein